MKNDESFGNYCENCEKRKASPNCEQTKKFGLAFKLQMENTHEYFVGYFQKRNSGFDLWAWEMICGIL